MCLHQNLKEESQGLESSQDHVIKESITCRSVSADSNATTDNDKGYDRRRDKAWLDGLVTSVKGKLSDDLAPMDRSNGEEQVKSRSMNQYGYVMI